MSYRHDSGVFIGKGGVEIFYQKWLAENSRANLLIVHGLGDHSSRFQNLIDELDGKNLTIYSFDLRGHGKSGGKRGHINSFMEYIYDLKIFIEYIKNDSKRLPIILYGHSMGGVISLRYSLTYAEDLFALILSSAGLTPTIQVPEMKLKLASRLSKYFPTFSSSNGLNPAFISHDEDVVKKYTEDPLVHDRVSARWFTEYTKACSECLSRSNELRIPLLVFHGEDDHIISNEGSQTVFKNAYSRNKELYIFKGLYHETINEIKKERDKVLKTITTFIKNALGQKSAPAKTETPVKSEPAVKSVATQTKKPAAKKPAAKKAPAKKPAAKKAPAKKPAAKKAPAKKPAKKK